MSRRDPNARKRARALALYAGGATTKVVAEAVGVSPSTARAWKAAARESAPEPAGPPATLRVLDDLGDEEDASLVEGSLRRAIVAAEDRGDHKATVAAAAAYSAHLARHGGSTGLDLVKALDDQTDDARRSMVASLDARTVGALHSALCERIATTFTVPGDAP